MLGYIFSKFYHSNKKQKLHNDLYMAYHTMSFLLVFNFLSANSILLYYWDVPLYFNSVSDVIILYVLCYVFYYIYLIYKKRYITLYDRFLSNRSKIKDIIASMYLWGTIISSIYGVYLARMKLIGHL
jgi:hypothetical protein